MKRYKPVLKVEAEMQNIEQVKELLPQIATLQQKYDIQLQINIIDQSEGLNPITFNPKLNVTLDDQ